VIETPYSSTEVLEHSGTWLTRPGGSGDFVLRGPRAPKPGLPGPLNIAGISIPFSGFLPSALNWSCEGECEGLWDRVSADSAERILVGTFTWGERTYFVSFVYFEDVPDWSLRDFADISLH